MKTRIFAVKFKNKGFVLKTTNDLKVIFTDDIEKCKTFKNIKVLNKWLADFRILYNLEYEPFIIEEYTVKTLYTKLTKNQSRLL